MLQSLAKLLHSPEVEVRAAAGEAIALLYHSCGLSNLDAFLESQHNQLHGDSASDSEQDIDHYNELVTQTRSAQSEPAPETQLPESAAQAQAPGNGNLSVLKQQSEAQSSASQEPCTGHDSSISLANGDAASQHESESQPQSGIHQQPQPESCITGTADSVCLSSSSSGSPLAATSSNSEHAASVQAAQSGRNSQHDSSGMPQQFQRLQSGSSSGHRPESAVATASAGPDPAGQTPCSASSSTAPAVATARADPPLPQPQHQLPAGPDQPLKAAVAKLGKQNRTSKGAQHPPARGGRNLQQQAEALSSGLDDVVTRMKDLAKNKGDVTRRSRRDRASLRGTFRELCNVVEVSNLYGISCARHWK